MFWNKTALFLLLCCLLSGTFSRLYGQVHVHQISSRNFNYLHEISFIDSVWYFHPEEKSWLGRHPALNTAGWDTIRHTAFSKNYTPRGWKGLGWFALWVKVDTNLVNTKLELRINHDGASEIFIDGKPVVGYGKLGTSADDMEAMRAPRALMPLWFGDTKPHLVSVHYANFIGVYPDFIGFQVAIGDYAARDKQLTNSRQLFDFVPVFAAAEIILGLLHLLLFFFYPRQKLNLYYAIFVLLVGINGIAVYFFYLTTSPRVQYVAELSTSLCKILLMWSGVGLLYTLNYSRATKWRQIILGAVSIFYLVYITVSFYFLPDSQLRDFFSLIFFIFILDGFWSVFNLLNKQQKDVWLIIAGVVATTLVYFFAWADVFGLWTNEYNAMRIFVMSAGNLVLPFCLSLYLALDFARTNQNLAARLVQVEELSAQALAQETEKSETIAAEAKRLEEIVMLRTAELSEKAEKLREMDGIKSRFFTNITHEFKTPLTLIINPAKELLANPNSGNSPGYLRFILNNANRLLQLINQLLELSKLESGLVELTPEPLNLVELVKEHINAWQSTAIPKGIALQYAGGPADLWLLGDRDKLDKVILNLLSNAVKFTENGRVEVFVQSAVADDTEHSLSLTVRDTGRGIAAAKLPYIFTRFYQADSSDTRTAEGTGIGLALVKELVELMNGTITAKSMEGLFTEMTIQLPYRQAEPLNQPLDEMSPQTELLPVGEADVVSIKTDDDRPIILLIEDHEELRMFMQQIMADKYRVLSAANGTAGLAMAFEKVPSLIVTDLMMPGLNGYQLSGKLKSDSRTSHIPIIILTAKADMESKLEGIEAGADAYLGKPFDQRELFALIDNLLNTRNQLRELYSTSDSWFKETSSMPSIEQDFIKRVRTAVESHLNEEGYSADQLATDLGLSRTQLHRKLKAITGQAPGELIRIVRLQYAHDLLQRRAATVAEVAYKVGFGSPASFSSSFSRHFGFPPSKVIES